MKKPTILLLILIVTTLFFVGWKSVGTDLPSAGDTQTKPVTDLIDVTLEVYDPWLAALKATSTEINQSELLATMPLTTQLRAKLEQALGDGQPIVDPIICQPQLPERIGVKSIFENETEAQVVVVARGNKVPEQALVTLAVTDNRWLVSDISCSQGEVAPQLEFSFAREGNLLKQSLQPPLDSSQWHLIYEKDGVQGYAIPLLFDQESICIQTDGSEQVCVPDQLSEVTAVSIKGAMQEAGALVRRMELK